MFEVIAIIVIIALLWHNFANNDESLFDAGCACGYMTEPMVGEDCGCGCGGFGKECLHACPTRCGGRRRRRACQLKYCEPNPCIRPSIGPCVNANEKIDVVGCDAGKICNSMMNICSEKRCENMTNDDNDAVTAAIKREQFCSANYGYVQCHGELERPIIPNCSMKYQGCSYRGNPNCMNSDRACANWTCFGKPVKLWGPMAPPQKRLLPVGCDRCPFTDDTTPVSLEPKSTWGCYPPIAPEVLPVVYYKPTGLKYERRDPPRGFCKALPLNLITGSPMIKFSDYKTIDNTRKCAIPVSYKSQEDGKMAKFQDDLYKLPGSSQTYFDKDNKFKESLQDSSNFENSQSTIVMYKTNWCPYCQQMEPIFNKVRAACKNTNIMFTVVDCEKTNCPQVTAYPTIQKIDKSGKVITYNGPPSYDKLFNFAMTPVVHDLIS